MRLTSKNAALVKTNNNSIFKSKASFDLHSHHAGNKYLDSHNNRQAGPGVGIVSAKWNTKQSQSKPLGFFNILFMISDDQIKNLHEQDIYDHMAINRIMIWTSRDHFTRLARLTFSILSCQNILLSKNFYSQWKRFVFQLFVLFLRPPFCNSYFCIPSGIILYPASLAGALQQHFKQSHPSSTVYLF